MESARKIADSFKIRASATHEIMGYPEKNVLPVGAKTYCKSWLKEKLFSRRPEVKSKYLTKGLQSEEDGFTLMAVQLGLGMVYKNTERRENEYSTGECDLSVNHRLFDNKCSWDLSTFPMFEYELPDKKYWWQMQTYAPLWDAEELNVCYTLVDASEELIKQATRYSTSDAERLNIIRNMVYTKESWAMYGDGDFKEIPDNRRVKNFDFIPEMGIAKQIQNRVHLCREYIYQLLNN